MNKEEQKILEGLRDNIDLGMMEQVGDDEFKLTSAGIAYIEDVLLAGIDDPQKAYALGRLQGLRESETPATPKE